MLRDFDRKEKEERGERKSESTVSDDDNGLTGGIHCTHYSVSTTDFAGCDLFE